MRKSMISMRMTKAILAAVVAVGLGTPAAAGTLFHWVTAEGTLSYTDNPKRVPPAYRGTAKKLVLNGLGDYTRFTPEDDAARRVYAERLHARLERLRAQSAAYEKARILAEHAAAGGGAGGTITEAIVQVDDRTSVRIPTNSAGEAPIVVEEVRVRPKGRIVTHHNTVVRRGDDILMVVRPNLDHQINASDVIDESELFE